MLRRNKNVHSQHNDSFTPRVVNVYIETMTRLVEEAQ